MKIVWVVAIILGLTLTAVSIRELVEKEYPREEKSSIVLGLVFGVILLIGGGYFLFR